jgi:hypothetical protein
MILAGAAVAVAASLAISGAVTASPRTKIEHLSFISTATSGSGNDFSAIATGAFTAGGTAVLPGKGGTLTFPGGTIKTSSKPGRQKNKFNSKLCLAISTRSGTYKLLSGTGVYKGISGSGKFRSSFTQVGPIVGGKCSMTANPVALQAIITASGPVSLP